MPPPVQPSPHRDLLLRRGVRLAHLRLMAALHESGQISAAAAQLAITQPAASRLLAGLEQALAAPLYERHARGVRLTAAGQLFATRAQAVLRQLDDIHHEIGEITGGARGLVRIGAVTGPALEIVLPVIRELRVTYPGIEIGVLVDTSDKLSDALLSREVEFYIGRLPDDVDARAVEMQPIGPEPVSLVVRLDHPLGRNPAPALADCLAYDWVMQPPGLPQRRAIERYLLENGYRLPMRILSTSSLLLSLAIISDTNAIAPVTRSVADFYAGRHRLGGNIRRLEIPEAIAVSPYSLITRAGEAPAPATARVLDLVRQKIRPLAAPPAVRS